MQLSGDAQSLPVDLLPLPARIRLKLVEAGYLFQWEVGESSAEELAKGEPKGPTRFWFHDRRTDAVACRFYVKTAKWAWKMPERYSKSAKAVS
jgi:hypothetical protein